MANFLRGNAQTFSNISATTAAFSLPAGNYGVTVTATFGGGSVTRASYRDASPGCGRGGRPRSRQERERAPGARGHGNSGASSIVRVRR